MDRASHENPSKLWSTTVNLILSTSLLFLALSANQLDKFLTIPWKAKLPKAASLKTSCGTIEPSWNDAVAFNGKGDSVQLVVLLRHIPNLFEVKKCLTSLKLSGSIQHLGSTESTKYPVQFLPMYQYYTNDYEERQEVAVYLQIPTSIQPFEGAYSLTTVDPAGREVQGFQFEVETKDSDLSRSLKKLPLGILANLKTLLIAFIALVLLANIIYVVRKSRPQLLMRGYLLKLLTLCILAETIGKYPNDLVGFGVIALFVLSHFYLGQMNRKSRTPNWIFHLWSLSILGFFLYYLTSFSSFRWSIFEERDFLAGLEASRFLHFPPMGPELLAGGQTPGGFLYLFFAPLLKFWPTPTALNWLNRFLFFTSAVLIRSILGKHFGRETALFGLILFCASHLVLSIAYWPIHPNMSLGFYYLFVLLLVYSFAESSLPVFAAASFLFSILVQLHVTYWVLLIPLLFLVFAMPFSSRRKLFGTLVGICILSLSPYLLYEFSTGFTNLRTILQAPRYHPSYVTIQTLMAYPILNLVREWIKGAWTGSLWLGPVCAIVALFSGLVILGQNIFKKKMNLEQKKTARASQVLVIFFGIPFILLTALGAGYSPRHIISFAPLIFLVLAVFGGSLMTSKSFCHRVAAWALALFCTNAFAREVLDHNASAAISRYSGEWAVDYSERRQMARKLVSDLHLSLEQYKNQVYWWWLGWSIAPDVYQAEMAENIEARENGGMSELSPQDTLFLFSGTETPSAPFSNSFSLRKIASTETHQIFVGTPKGLSVPLSNTRNTARLTPLEEKIQEYGFPTDVDAVKLAVSPISDSNEAYMVQIHGSRIKLLLSLHAEYDSVANRSLVTWKVISPSLSGHYQEIKSLWKPSMKFSQVESSVVQRFNLSADILGGLLNKTAMGEKIPFGSVTLKGELKDYKIELSVAGWFDESNMTEPTISDRFFDLRSAPTIEFMGI